MGGFMWTHRLKLSDQVLKLLLLLCTLLFFTHTYFSVLVTKHV
jgi:hypothetical protein